MWQSSSQRIKAILNSRRRERERLKNSFHIKRLEVDLEVIGSENLGVEHQTVRLIFNDFSNKGGGFYSQKSLIPGQQVKLTIKDPVEIVIFGRVIWCQEHNAGSHIISANAYHFRSGIEFTPKSEDETKAIQAFCDELFKAQNLSQQS